MTNQDYIDAYQALINRHFDGHANMEQHLVAVQALKDRYIKERNGGELPVVP